MAFYRYNVVIIIFCTVDDFVRLILIISLRRQLTFLPYYYTSIIITDNIAVRFVFKRIIDDNNIIVYYNVTII